MTTELLALICGIVGSAVGAFVGVKVTIASLKERVHMLEEEVRLLRESKHDHAQHITRHDADIEVLKRRVGDQR